MAERNEKVKKQNRFRLIFLACYTAVTNGYLKGFIEGKIYTGPLKRVCVPGLNCYSCPGALGACPIGSLQAALGSRHSRFAFYVTGLLMLFGAFLGRVVCGFLCPFGLAQELLHKIPFPKKLRALPGERGLRLMKYGIFAVFVILLPSVVRDLTGAGDPWFCKYICPSGTLFGGIPNVAGNPYLRAAAGGLFRWKLGVLLFIVLLSAAVFRPFCRYFCPLGAIYGLFNKISLYRFRVDGDKCVSCGLCQKTCEFDIKVWQNPNSPDCIRCGSCRAACPQGAIEVLRPLKTEKKTGES